MEGLLLKLTDRMGEATEVLVESEVFEIGRHSENDLSLVNSAVSRKHVKIEKFAHIYTVTDVGSTLGTALNGEPLNEPKVLKNGDVLLLGEAIKIDVILGDEANENEEQNPPAVSPEASGAPASVSAVSNGGGSISIGWFVLAPILVVAVLLGAGGLFLFLGGANKTGGENSAENTEFVYASDRLNNDKNKPEDIVPANPEQAATPETTSTAETSIDDAPPLNTDSGGTDTTTSPPVNTDDLGKIEISSAQFLRKVAVSDSSAFLLGEQQRIVKSQIDQLKNSPALAGNIKSAAANSARIAEIAASKNLKPQLLAVAAIARLGNTRGDVAQTAQNMAGTLDETSRNIGMERADDVLISIAAYDEVASGRTLDMRNMLQSLESKFPGNPRRIRTIWFLKEKNLITGAQFQAALNFLAVGTIAQNPGDFGFSVEPLNL